MKTVFYVGVFLSYLEEGYFANTAKSQQVGTYSKERQSASNMT